MGDRAVISNKNKNLGIYLHWYGYREFVESVLAYCDLKQYRNPDVDDEYGWARLCQVLGNTLGGTISLGIGKFERMDTDNWDNGTYIIEGWDIKERLYQQYEDAKMKDSMFENLKYINDKQPKDEQLKEEELKAYAELWEIKHIDRLNDERKAYVEDKIKKQKQEEKEMREAVYLELFGYIPTDEEIELIQRVAMAEGGNTESIEGIVMELIVISNRCLLHDYP